MNLFILVCLILCWTQIMCEEPAGIIQKMRKKVLAGDMTYILKAIFENVKAWSFQDIDEKLVGASNKGLKISEINVQEVKFSADPADYILTLDKNTFKISIETKKTTLIYLIDFKWEATSAGVHVAFGKGTAQFESKSILASYNAVKPASTVEVQWAVSLKKFTGIIPSQGGIKTWVLNKISSNVASEINNAIKYNKNFLHEYMHNHTTNLRRTLNDRFTLDYNSQIFNVTETGDYLTYLHKVWLELNDDYISEVTIGVPFSFLEKFTHDVSIGVAPQYIPLTIDAHGLARKCDYYANPKDLGLTGTVKDLFGALPELYSQYNENEEFKIFCEVAHKGIESNLPGNKLELPMTCNFLVKGNTVLSSDVIFNIKYTPDAGGKFFKTKMSDVTIAKCTSKPESLFTVMFLVDLFNKLGQVKFEGKVHDVPMILYTPKVFTNKSESVIEKGVFVVHYDY